MDYRDPRPIYEQIRQQIMHLILSGAIAPGEKLPSVRDLAGTLSINPNTIQRAYRELEADGYLVSIPGKGSFASEARPLQVQRKLEILTQIHTLVLEATALGATREELLTQLSQEEDRHD